MEPWTEESLSDELIQFIAAEFPAGVGVQPDTTLPQAVLDSLGIFTMVGFMENRFGVKLDDSDLTIENFENVRTLAKLVVSKG